MFIIFCQGQSIYIFALTHSCISKSKKTDIVCDTKAALENESRYIQLFRCQLYRRRNPFETGVVKTPATVSNHGK